MAQPDPRPKPEESARRLPPRSVATTTGTLPPLPLRVIRSDATVGSTRLEHALSPSGAYAGKLTPGPALDDVRDVFALYQLAGTDPRALSEFVRARDALGLRLVDPNGDPVDGKVDLISDWGAGHFVVHATLA